ncbi:uncharacterized protein BDR25DRAFT_96328 [Lindgomyces ingoldianus]|uniref:Uncharacterized protein n=1 Tax=Lindgomyces ingoldianus TaxID=673940 RepID=A0ACB6QDJ8_9PLEO|nr:uncharacterized protein BDR25DRAFT_96328 [Lindgomyces ingoldianus]KAF2464442.1 hypothetical protein BDR25DRAFT_96328 [Lindgomyces ingoldianus]
MILIRLFGLNPRPTPQRKSRLLNLPLEIRNEIYMYVFASSLVNEPDEKPLSTWDHLLLCCRQVKKEMESMPSQPIIGLVKAHWEEEFPKHPLQVSATIEDGKVQELVVAIPRAVFQPAYKEQVATYIPDYVSPLFRIFTEKLTLTIHDDGAPLIHSGHVPVYELFSQVLSLVWARDPTMTRLGRKIYSNPLPLPPCRNFFNTRRLAIRWEGHMVPWQGTHHRVLFLMGLEWFFSKPWRSRIGLRSRQFTLSWEDRTHYIIEGVSWESSSRFRR